MKTKRMIGNEYEEKAAQYLMEAGYGILERNVNYPWGEIDLVVRDPVRNELVFVEVRGRSEGAMVTAEESVGYAKLKRLTRAIDTFLVSRQFLDRKWEPAGVRIDLIAFEADRPTHWRNFI